MRRVDSLEYRVCNRLVTLAICCCLVGCGGTSVGGESTSSRDASDAHDARTQQDSSPDTPPPTDDAGRPADAARDTWDPGDVAAELDTQPGEEPGVLWREGDCAHPQVEKNCQDGWCLIPAGCFLIGSPKNEVGRVGYEEDQATVTFTRPFQIQQYAFTYGQWLELGLLEQEDGADQPCIDPTCPAAGLTVFEAMLLANLVSEKHTPALPPCYKLTECDRELGRGVVCEWFEITAPTLYECTGFRLPTEHEWEYAARAGTRTPFYGGGFSPNADPNISDPVLDPIAWYLANFNMRIHPVGLKEANQWGLYDMLGNVEEWTNSAYVSYGYGSEPLVDPDGTHIVQKYRTTRGGSFPFMPVQVRSASRNAQEVIRRQASVRLVRTGAANPGSLPTIHQASTPSSRGPVETLCPKEPYDEE